MSAGSGAPLRHHRQLGLSVAAVIILLDQLAKYIVTYILQLPTRGPLGIELTPFFNLSWTRNYGVSMGFFHADSDPGRWFLVLMTLAIAGFVFWWLWRERARNDVIGLGLVLGGALGNILDRMRLGYVVDYADFHLGNWRPFLIFNLADAAITIGVLILLARALLLREKAPSKESQ